MGARHRLYNVTLTRKEIVMTCKSAIYTVNNTNTTVTVTNDTPVQIPFGSIIRRFGKYINLDGNSIFCYDSGYFDVNVSLTVSPTAATAITAQLYQDGVAIPGALATATPAEAEAPVTLPISTLIRNCGCNCSSVLTLKISASCIVNNLATVVEKK